MTLEELIASNPDPRELKRGDAERLTFAGRKGTGGVSPRAVKMRIQGHKHREIQPVLGVHSSYISRWEGRYREQGVAGLRLKYRGSVGYLSSQQRLAVIEWIGQKTQTTLWEVIDHIENSYDVVYRSLQSYYELLQSAGMSWHQGVKKVPDMMNLWCRTTTR